jgi:hypothetical protein
MLNYAFSFVNQVTTTQPMENATSVDSLAPGTWPSPVGLCLGILSVAVGQVGVLIYQYLRIKYGVFSPRKIQWADKLNKPYEFWEGVATHLAQPEGFVLLGGYLSLTWMLNLLPSTYYSFEGGVNWVHVLLQLLIQVRFALKFAPLLLF